MVTASNRNSGETKEDKKSTGPSPSNGHVSAHCDDAEKDGDTGMRVGKAFQAEIPSMLPSHERRPEQCPERALLVWAPKLELNEESLEQYIWLAKDKYGYNAEQALGMLFWHRHDLEKATADLANFTPFPDEWTTEDKVLFEQAFQFHGKSFHRIRQMLPDKTIAQLVKYYYLWKKTRQRSSLIDRHARKHTAKLQQVSEGVVGDSSGDRSEEDEEGRTGEETKTCSNCTIPASVLNESPKGLQCLTCYNHWKKMGCLRPTVGPMKRDKQLIKHKRRPPRGMHINHEEIIEEDGYTPQQVFTVDETELYWKWMPARNFISAEEKTSSGLKVSKDHLTLLVGGNVAGDFKLKPLIVYHTEMPRALKAYGKPKLPLIWCSNKKALVTINIFQDWFLHYFCPAVEKYCTTNNIAHKVLLLIDNASCHSFNLNNLSEHVRVEFLPMNIMAMIQQMDEGVIATLETYYLRRTFAQLIRETEGGNKPAIKEFWESFGIMNAIGNICDSWNEITSETMNSVWKILWPDCIHGFKETAQGILQNIVNFARDVGFEDFDETDVVELSDSDGENLSDDDDELVKLELKQATSGEDEEEKADTDPTPQLTLKQLSKSFNLIEAALAIYTENDPNLECSIKVRSKMDNAIACYRELYREKQRRAEQPSLEKQKFLHPSTRLIISGKRPPLAEVRPTSINLTCSKNISLKTSQSEEREGSPASLTPSN